MRRRERGSMQLMIGASILMLAVFGLGGATLGRIVAAKMDLQRASDSAALGGAEAVRQRGRGQVNGAVAAALPNSRNAALAYDPLIERADRIIIPARATVGLAVPALAMNGQPGVNVRAGASAFVMQARFNTVNPPHPDVVLVLDYSGSMAGEKMALLKESVNEEALKADLPIDWAAVLFDSSVIDKVDFRPLDPANLKKDISDVVNKHDAGAGTQTDAGFDQARDYLNHIKDTTTANERYVLLVSDGVPNSPDAATTAANKIWDETGATIITLLVGGDTTGGEWMKQVSGTKEHHPDPQWYIQATDPETLKQRFKEIILRLGCPLPPLPNNVESPGPACLNNQFNPGCERMGGILRPKGSTGPEQSVPVTNDLVALGNDGLGFSYDPTSRKVTASSALCKAVHDGGDEFIVRYNRAKLTQ
jgi:uncharacterized protein YegL